MTNWLILVVISCLAVDKANAAVQSASDVLRGLDSARTTADFKSTYASLKLLGSESTQTLESYALNPAKDARNRMLVLRFVLDKRLTEGASKTLQNLVRSSSDENFKALCAEELGRRPSPEGKKLLQDLLVNSSEASQVQIAAAMGLAEMGDDSGKERATKAVLQNEPWANMAIRALEKLRAKDVIPRIEQAALNSKTPYDRSKARIAVFRIKLAGKPSGEQLDILENALRDKDSREVRKWAAVHLAGIGTPLAGQRLASVAGDGDHILADSAMRGLRSGVERGAWTKEEVSTWMGKHERKENHSEKHHDR